jgi:NADH dehydrogenase
MMGDIRDSDSLLAAMDGVHTIVHLVGTEKRGRHAMLDEVDVEGTRHLVEAAAAARVGRIIAMSRLGADTASAFAVQRAKGEIERIICNSGLSYTIFRSAVLFGKGDLFSEHIAMLARAFPVFFVPGEGEMVLQPLWVEDLVTCLAMSLEDLELLDKTLTVGGPELLSYRRIIMRVMRASHSQRPILGVPPLMARLVSWYLDGLFVRWPFNEFWIELLSTAQTGELGSVERQFGFRPIAFDIGLIDEYMKKRRYGLAFVRHIFTRDW